MSPCLRGVAGLRRPGYYHLLLHCRPTGRASKTHTSLWNRSNYSLFPWSDGTTSAYLSLSLFLFLFLFSVSVSSLLETGRYYTQSKRYYTQSKAPRQKKKEENRGWKSSASGSQEKKPLKQFLSQQKTQMRYLTKGNNYLLNEANLKLSNKNKLRWECKGNAIIQMGWKCKCGVLCGGNKEPEASVR